MRDAASTELGSLLVDLLLKFMSAVSFAPMPFFIGDRNAPVAVIGRLSERLIKCNILMSAV